MTAHPLGPLAEWPQWIVARIVPQPNGKALKLPLHPVTLQPHDAHDPAAWLDYGTAAGAARAAGYGIGFVLTERDPFWCLDIDSCLTPAGWSPLAQSLCTALPGCVVEVSQSGRGLHFWGRGSIPPHRSKNVPLGIELYSDRRFILLGTGAVGTMAPTCPSVADVVARYFAPEAPSAADVPEDGPCPEWSGYADDDELIRRAITSRTAAATFSTPGKAGFSDLWAADAAVLARAYPSSTGDVYDRSSADAALAQHLAWWTGRDAGRIDRLMRRSALAREKWERDDYMARTIHGACARTPKVFGQDRTATVAAAIVTTPGAAVASGGASKRFGEDLPATLQLVHEKLASPESGVQIAHDAFLDQTMIRSAGTPWAPITDASYGWLRKGFGERGFKPVSPEIMRTSVLMVADANRFDSATEWAESLRWDGTPRIDAALPRYYRTADTPYTRAVGAYLWTALAGRALVPGCQVDMAPVFVGMQGERKTSAVRALSPERRFFAELSLKHIDDDDTARLVRGKLVGEIAELRGLLGRDQEEIKAWITRREEEWTPKYREYSTTYPRRLVLIGTTNEREFLDDPTGERRWLPVEAGTVDVEALERDREQLWAEGVARFKVSGIAWQEAERLARAEHARFKVADAWQDVVTEWLALPPAPGAQPRGAAPFKLADVSLGALGRSPQSLARHEELRLGKVLRNLGFEKIDGRHEGRVCKVWRRSVALAAQATGGRAT